MLQPKRFPDTRPSLIATLGEGPEGQSAWREFFSRYGPAIYRVARLRGLADEDADDIVQQVMVSISSHIGDFQYDRDRGRFRHWVRTITENKIRQNARRGQLPVAAETDVSVCADDGPTLEDVWDREWQLQDILWCLDQASEDISPRRMEAFRMYAIDGVPANEVAKRLDMSVGHVYVVRHLVLNMIRKRIKKLDEAE
ncbi:MAG: sigma-70 family RNA polymerase sigma factor [Phycisphaerales bacterium]|nr:sigma-70 family RNA polymerase sigma factor [Phycisphaerales bacterium]MCB9862765.1 sigma-70 family RNA polymerase sigma factor [Phycisphaerales bacterium]